MIARRGFRSSSDGSTLASSPFTSASMLGVDSVTGMSASGTVTSFSRDGVGGTSEGLHVSLSLCGAEERGQVGVGVGVENDGLRDAEAVSLDWLTEFSEPGVLLIPPDA